MASKFRGSGQTCVSANRLFVHSSISKEFVGKLKIAMSSLKTGNGLENGTTQVIINSSQLFTVLLLRVL